MAESSRGTHQLTISRIARRRTVVDRTAGRPDFRPRHTRGNARRRDKSAPRFRATKRLSAQIRPAPLFAKSKSLDLSARRGPRDLVSRKSRRLGRCQRRWETPGSAQTHRCASRPNRATRATIAFPESDRPDRPRAGDAYATASVVSPRLADGCFSPAMQKPSRSRPASAALSLHYGVGRPPARSDRPALAVRVIGLRGNEWRISSDPQPLRRDRFQSSAAR